MGNEPLTASSSDKRRRFFTRKQPLVPPRPKRSRWPFSHAKNRRVGVFEAPLYDRLSQKTQGVWQSARDLTRVWILLAISFGLMSVFMLAKQFVLRSEHFRVRNVRIANLRHVTASSLRARLS